MIAIIAAGALAACPCKAKLWPASGETVPTNTRIQITLCGDVSAFAEKLVLAAPKLVAGKDSVSLQPGDTLSSPVESRMILTPERPLTPKLKYKLVLDPKQDKALAPFKVPLAGVSWTAGAGPDESKPTWSGTPSAGPVKLEKKQLWTDVKVPLKDAKGGQVLVELEERGGTEGAREYQFDGKSGTVRIGGECSPLQLKPLTKYHATFTAVDIAGNTAAAGSPVEFETPNDLPPDAGAH